MMEDKLKLICKWNEYKNGLSVFYFPRRLNDSFVTGDIFPQSIVAWKCRLGMDGFRIQDKLHKCWVVLPEWKIPPEEARLVLQQEFAERGVEVEFRIYHFRMEYEYDKRLLI